MEPGVPPYRPSSSFLLGQLAHPPAPAAHGGTLRHHHHRHLLNSPPAKSPSTVTLPDSGPPTLPRLSSGLIYYTVESLEGSMAPYLLAPSDAGMAVAGGSILSQGFQIHDRGLQPLQPPSYTDLSYTQQLQRALPSAGTPSLTLNQAARSSDSDVGYMKLSAWSGDQDAELASAYRLSRELQGDYHKKSLERGQSQFGRTDFGRNIVTSPSPFQKFGQAQLGTETRPAASAATTGWQGKPSLYCSLCKVYCSSVSALNEHVAGKKHKKEEERLVELKAQKDDANREKGEDTRGKGSRDVTEADEASLVVAIGKELEAESNKRKQKSKEVQNAKRPQLDKASDATDSPVTGSSKEILKKASAEKCEVCNVLCSSAITLKDHLRGKKHAAYVKKLQELEADTKKGKPGLIANGGI